MVATHPFAHEARDLLAGVADRLVSGPLEDPATLAAVVGVERLAVESGTTDADALTALLDVATDSPTALTDLAEEVVLRVATALVGRDGFRGREGSLVNADAGAYPVAADAEVLRAGVRAAHRTFQDHPYYAIRYGARGSRWAASDSSWIGHLLTAAPPVAVRQVTWLSSYLTRKGMPTWLMESHLRAFAHELVAADVAPGPLAAVADHLRDGRAPYADDAVLEEAEAAVAATVEAPPAPDAGRLLAAGVADVLSGAAPDDAPLLDWFTDPVRVSAVDAAALLAVRDSVRGASSPTAPTSAG